MRTHAFSVRTRLALAYAAAFAVGGVILVAVTYAMVAHNLHAAPSPAGGTDQATVNLCAKAAGTPAMTGALAEKCAAGFNSGVASGAQAQRAQTLNHLLLSSLGALIVAIVLAAAGGWVLAGRILRPVHRLTQAAREASADNLVGTRLAMTGPRDELRDLADTFDDMLDRLDNAFTSQRQFIANAGHELRTPLTVLRTSIEVTLAKKSPTRAELDALGAKAVAEIAHAHLILEGLLALARTERGPVSQKDLSLREVIDHARTGINIRGLHIVDTAQDATVQGDPVLLERLIANLLDNACRYNIPDGVVRLATETHDGAVTLTISNTGPVVPPEQVAELFEPFRRLKQRTGTGSGLGLSLVRAVATLHHAELTTSAPPTGGLSHSLRLLISAP